MNEAATHPEGRPAERPLLAPLWHTTALIAIFVAIAATGAYLQMNARPGHQLVAHRGSVLPLYLSLIAAEWGLVRFVAVGLKRSRTRLRDVIGGRWTNAKEIVRDALIALAVWAAWIGAEALANRLLPPDAAKGISTLLPRGSAEGAAWSLLSLSAGFCEEVVFRGYLQRQFGALTGRAFPAILLQAVVFGVSHGYQGPRNAVTISVLGAVYGALAHWRKSLRPGMVLHAWMDIFGGLVRI